MNSKTEPTETPKDTRLIREITLRNILSFGPDTPPFELRPLNVLIGANGSGKSNLIDCIGLMRSTPGDMRSVIRAGGTTEEWIWKGANSSQAMASLIIDNPKGKQPLRHKIEFSSGRNGFTIIDERIENENAYPGEEHKGPYFYYHFNFGQPQINTVIPNTGFGYNYGNDFGGTGRKLSPDSIELDQSVLAQRQEPEIYPELAYLSNMYWNIRIYRDWTFGRGAPLRGSQPSDFRVSRLEENFSNLGLFLNFLRRKPTVKKQIVEALNDLYEEFTDFGLDIVGGTVQLYFEEGDFNIPATRLSDGTLRYLALLAILYDPDPPKLICIDEPELGLHPDILPSLADHLISASERTQLIITTHSEILVDAMTETPESVVVCEKHNGKTEMQRLKAGDLEPYLGEYRLGNLWIDGDLGGKRW